MVLLEKEKQILPIELVATPVQSSSKKMKLLLQQPVNNIKQIQRQRVNLVQTRRKWSEWSECSVNCLRTRHRRNCDDIVSQNATLLQQQASTGVANSKRPSTANNISASPSISEPNEGRASLSSKRQVDSDDKTSSENESEDELLQRADQFEDEDYADEGDEEDDQDSCANVDASKTLEEVPCFGGQCRLAVPPASIDHQLPPAARRPSGQQHRERPLGGSAAQQTRLRPDQALHKVAPPPPIYDHPTVVDGSSRYHHHLNQQQPQLAHKQRQPASRRNGTGTTRLENEKDNSSLSSTPLLSASAGESTNNATLAVTTNEQTNSLTSGSSKENAIWTTRNIWPPQLLNGDLGPQANLIQWTILIGSLLTIILLIMLILRKLFVSAIPSYHWMLAKQTIKSASGQQLGNNQGGSSNSSGSASLDSDRCQRQYQYRQALVAAAGTRAASITTTMTPTTCDRNRLQLDRHQQQPIVPHQLCYVWHNATDGQSKHSPAALTAMPANLQQHHHHQQQQQLVVDASGRHLLSDSSLTGPKFNTDNHLIPVAASHSDCLRASPVYMDVSAAMMTSSSSSSSRSRAARQPQLQPKASQACKQEDCDGLSIVPHNYNYDTLHSDGYDQQDPRVGNDTFVLTRDIVVSSRPAQLVQRSLSNPASERLAAKQGCSSNSNRMRTAADIESNGTLDRSNSGTESRSRVSSISRSSSSSVQSTTAQMLSNAASSSFEQPNELPGELGPSAPGVAAASSSGILLLQSANASPASNGRKLRHNSAAKLAYLLPQTVQSQPSSPMFVNQFMSKASGKRHKVTPSSIRTPILAQTRNRVARGHAVANNRKQGHARKPSIPGNELTATIKLAQQQEQASSSQESPERSEQVDCDNYYEEINQQEWQSQS